MKIFFGRKPDNGILLDSLLYEFLIKHDYNLNAATEEIKSINDDQNYYTINPMIFQYADLLDKTYMITECDEVVCVKNDESILKKLTMLGLGEALVDDSRAYRDI